MKPSMKNNFTFKQFHMHFDNLIQLFPTLPMKYEE